MNTSETLKKPGVIAAICLLAGIALGLLWGWVISPVEWINASPANMGAQFQTDYMSMAIDSYQLKPNGALAQARYAALGPSAPQALASAQTVADPTAFAQFSQVVSTVNVQPAESSGPGSGILGTVFIALAVVLILGVIVFAVYFLFRSGRKGPKSAAAQGIEYSKAASKTDFAASGQEPPVAQYVTTYVLGDDLFDDSFSIDSPAGEFLGECGVGISETVGVGDPKKVTAFEVWMFDKNDIQTVTKVMMTQHAYDDISVRAKLESKGELILMEPGKQVVLETATLQLVAMMADFQYGQGALPAQSFVERLTLELAVWPKAS